MKTDPSGSGGACGGRCLPTNNASVRLVDANIEETHNDHADGNRNAPNVTENVWVVHDGNTPEIGPADERGLRASKPVVPSHHSSLPKAKTEAVISSSAGSPRKTNFLAKTETNLQTAGDSRVMQMGPHAVPNCLKSGPAIATAALKLRAAGAA